MVRLASAAVPGAILTATGFDQGKYPGGRYPTRWELDRAAPANPVMLFHVSGHHVLVNSRVLADAGLDDDALDPPGGRLERDAEGRLTGLCLDAAMGLAVPTQVDVGSHGPNFHMAAPLAQLVEAVERAGTAFLDAGLTTVCDAQVTSRELVAYRAARDQGRLPVRTVCMPLSHQLEAYGEVGIATGFGDDELAIGHLKCYADGTLTGGTAAFTEDSPFTDRFTASFFLEPDRLRDVVVEAYRQGWRVGVHAQGDRAIGAVLDAFDAAQATHPRADQRPRIEHAGYPTSEQIARMADLGVIPVTQPSYLFDSGDQYRRLMGSAADRLQPWRAMLDAGLRLVISSDSDVADYRPLTTLGNALERASSSGDVLGEEQRLTLDEALFAHTIDAAFACGWEDRVGSLEPGKLADLVILGSDRAALEGDVRGGTAEVVACLIGGTARAGADAALVGVPSEDLPD